MVKKEAAKSCLAWKGINNRMLVAHFTTKKCKLSVTAVYAVVAPTDREIHDTNEFYLKL
jgi:hypothetical protein